MTKEPEQASRTPITADPIDRSLPLWERLRPLQDRIASYPSTGLKADKAFYDWLSGEDVEPPPDLA